MKYRSERANEECRLTEYEEHKGRLIQDINADIAVSRIT
jgi:hypothetical protein